MGERMGIRIDLTEAMFGETERRLCAFEGISVTTFRYASGVAGLRIGTRRGEVVILPFRGQQIWRARFDGREFAMRSMFDEPARSTTYLETYGAFLIHCGLTGIGAPEAGDSHPLHGELPSAPFEDAWLDLDEAAGRVTLGGVFRYAVAFSTRYTLTATLGIGRDETLIDCHLRLRNDKRTPMEVLYLAHINFRPSDGATLHYTAPYTPEAVRVRRSIPAHVRAGPGYAEFLEALAADPTLHHRLEPGLGFDPEVVFAIDAVADEAGWAHAVQRHADGSADYVAHRPDQAPRLNRWICRTPDQDAIGFSFPSTSSTLGRRNEVEAGRFVPLDGEREWHLDMRFGRLSADEADRRIEAIDRLMGRTTG
ncbi:protein of unknown function [Aureimonas jatrophae]|uniref:Galactose mutarotase n=2 Tax=Aureimonas jatrophae TaxID=1166073 RepID=A0A1H0JIJ8_9HYPH|nr:protein of unknown function [Aureimonas jatrophae]